ncbi:hypothetical protein HXX76_015682 [Chlamydomonas incerta]|uniref:non-specific serine/threonine protein kinase n=1 Tax=Chlamydomonas incerta TaxID=51695 RepID=A0A835SN22_CHLIN|nr:hypothetical protein HXX76_015682 [Chlamydomonas incerta]|eukprot:KAG2422931.1 hypothetical protein HXX76_015682 [Chlamydomonas incerta]
MVLVRHLRRQAADLRSRQGQSFTSALVPGISISALAPSDKRLPTIEEPATAHALCHADADTLPATDITGTTAAPAHVEDCFECPSDSPCDSSSDSDNEAPSPSGQQSLSAYLSCHGLDRCVFVKVLGQGGFGRADLVTIPLPGGGAMEAVRKVLFQSTDGISQTEALYREVAGMRAVEGCRSAVQLLGSTQPKTAGDPHELLMSWAPGGALSTYLDTLKRLRSYSTPVSRPRNGKKGKGEPAVPPTLLPESLIKVLAKCVLTAVDAMHSNSVCHGDIKSDNVFLDESDGGIRFVLGDMGLAEQADDAGFVRGRAGTRRYAAPELHTQLVGGVAECGVTLKSDMASVGMLLAEAAAFRSKPAQLRRYMRYECDLPPQTPPALKDLIEKLVDMSPDARPSAKEALAHPHLMD